MIVVNSQIFINNGALEPETVQVLLESQSVFGSFAFNRVLL